MDQNYIDKQVKQGKVLVVINKLVYDLTDFKTRHPGGFKILEKYNGYDVTRQFEVVIRHSEKAKEMMKEFFIGSFQDRRQKVSWDHIRSNQEKLYIVISNNLYDCTEFADNHPGGKEILQLYKNQNATEAFKRLGHSQEAREKMDLYKIGELEHKKAEGNSQRWLLFFIGLVIAYIYKSIAY
ncbi:unnamed protein product (macronuclear) [Paramecium tetraurelia]|uniref:Cytochrome b5 heme-binding domain-containing protein n=1 Tax=Paramecium tetraurelia TaxID=5888 RepID=A0DIJ8_PARTE|nr:uncharacterized protein GSPATT00017222001 [Paramecium tetraurelia]CAK82865.1 unnamed protein product [Paramecium tetraurelia]|eukprot:XP_001450262.1 hypothetical protein (macronuclear) [Paramecium tetraurelia strain d4-2]